MNQFQSTQCPSVQFKLHREAIQYNLPQLESVSKLMARHSERFPRLTVLRFDLRFPEGQLFDDPAVISRFIDSLKAKLHVWDHKRRSNHAIGFGYAWCREQARSQNWHYHVVFFFNSNALNCWGKFQLDRDNLFNRVVSAWASATQLSMATSAGLVYCCEEVYQLNQTTPSYYTQLDEVMRRLSYLAKKQSKDIDDGNRCFGCSQSIFLG